MSLTDVVSALLDVVMAFDWQLGHLTLIN